MTENKTNDKTIEHPYCGDCRRCNISHCPLCCVSQDKFDANGVIINRYVDITFPWYYIPRQKDAAKHPNIHYPHMTTLEITVCGECSDKLATKEYAAIFNEQKHIKILKRQDSFSSVNGQPNSVFVFGWDYWDCLDNLDVNLGVY